MSAVLLSNHLMAKFLLYELSHEVDELQWHGSVWGRYASDHIQLPYITFEMAFPALIDRCNCAELVLPTGSWTVPHCSQMYVSRLLLVLTATLLPYRYSWNWLIMAHFSARNLSFCVGYLSSILPRDWLTYPVILLMPFWFWWSIEPSPKMHVSVCSLKGFLKCAYAKIGAELQISLRFQKDSSNSPSHSIILFFLDASSPEISIYKGWVTCAKLWMIWC